MLIIFARAALDNDPREAAVLLHPSKETPAGATRRRDP